ncbi:MAG: four helix bundle protein [Saprospiraceae bacterium]|nr:four helix bundle protein [Saprospiraceae bacterium]
MRDYTRLHAFKLADELVLSVYRITAFFPKEEIYGLTAQIRRSICSVTFNIVEGSFRESQKEYGRFLEIAFSSLKESHYQINLAFRLHFIDNKSYEIIDKKFLTVEKLLAALLRFIKKSNKNDIEI